MNIADPSEIEMRVADAEAFDRMNDCQLEREIRFQITKGMATMTLDSNHLYVFQMSGRRATSAISELHAVRNWIKAVLERDAG